MTMNPASTPTPTPTNPPPTGGGSNNPPASASTSTNTAPGGTQDGFQPSIPRYTVYHSFQSGDRVMVRICEDTIATWRHGTVSDMTKYPPRAETHGQWSYPVEYPTRGRVDRGWFNPAFHEIQFDTYLSNIGARRGGWQ
ncbi:hypothetical protein GSI_07830 [Ganoderma sinense ZZ0214-1]|uniref:Uncharacterized protein n=1 Tax=Ganoderma sinense ZZ0214-1 TaxID=1077348 RepID=A0A2G8S814_9APHY|nr:hypothetical protein GSI_07830 [Ganoderma sinense ZZ0214-1]